MTVVFSNTGDTDTRVLAALWEGYPDARVLRSLRVTKTLERRSGAWPPRTPRETWR